MSDNLFDMNLKLCVKFFWVHSWFIWHLMNNFNDSSKYLGSVLFHESHELFDFFIFRFFDNHFVTFFQISVKLLSKLIMVKKGMIHLNKAIIWILCLLIFPKELSNVFIRLNILIFKFVKPLLGHFNSNLFHLTKVLFSSQS